MFIAFCPSEVPIQDLAASGFYLKKVHSCLSPDLSGLFLCVCVFHSKEALGLLLFFLTWDDGLSSLAVVLEAGKNEDGAQRLFK